MIPTPEVSKAIFQLINFVLLNLYNPIIGLGIAPVLEVPTARCGGSPKAIKIGVVNSPPPPTIEP